MGGVNRCTGTSLRLSRPTPVAHVGTPTVYYVMNQNNDLSAISDGYISAYAAECVTIIGDQSTKHKFDRLVCTGLQAAGTFGIRTGYAWPGGFASISGGDFTTRSSNIQANDIDYYLYNTGCGVFNVFGGDAENSVRLLETPFAGGCTVVNINGVRWSTNRLNADTFPIVYKGQGELMVSNSTIQGYLQSDYMVNDNVASNGGGPALVRITTHVAHGLVNGDWVQVSNVYRAGGTHEANGLYQVTVFDATNYDLPVAFVNAATAFGNTYKGVPKLYCEISNSCFAQNNIITSTVLEPINNQSYWRTDNNIPVSADLWVPSNAPRRIINSTCTAFTNLATTPSIRGGNCFVFNNNAPTTVTGFTDIGIGQKFIVYSIDANNTTVQFSGLNIRGNSNTDMLLRTYDMLNCVGATATIAYCSPGIVDWARPGAIGNVTPNTGEFTTLSSTTSRITAGSGTGVTVNAVGSVTQEVYKVTVLYTNCIAASVNCDLTIGTLPAKTYLVQVLADLTVPYVCAVTCTTATLTGTLGRSAGATEFLAAFDADAAAALFGDANAELGTEMIAAARVANGALIPGVLGSWTATTTLVYRLNSGTGDLGTGAATNLNAGSVTFYIVTSKMP